MISSISKAAQFEATKPQASTPNFMLSLLAACSSSIPAAGSEGEATLVAQLYGLLEDKAMAVDELGMLYTYRFGISIKDALKFIGFQGKVMDFFDQHKRFSMHDGCISLLPAAAPTIEEGPADAEKPAPEDNCAKGADDETASTASTADAESCLLDSDSDIDITGWQSVGNRLVAALDSPRCTEADVDVSPWGVLGGRVASALHASDDENDADAEAWHDVGSRILLAWKCSSDDEGWEDLSPDVDEWRSVGTRILRCLDGLDSDTADL